MSSSDSPVLMRTVSLQTILDEACKSDDRSASGQEFSSPSPEPEEEHEDMESVRELYRDVAEAYYVYEYNTNISADIPEHHLESERNILTSILLDPECGPSDSNASNRMVILKRDISSPETFDIRIYHNKILTMEDANHLFTGGLVKIIRELINKRFIILIQKKELTNTDPEIICSILVTGTLETVLRELNIDFSVQVVYPDSTSKYVRLEHHISDNGQDIIFRIDRNCSILCVSNSEKDLLHMNVRYTYGHGEKKKMRHRLTKTTITVGEYAKKAKLDSDSLTRAIKRINQVWQIPGIWNAIPGATIKSFLNPEIGCLSSGKKEFTRLPPKNMPLKMSGPNQPESSSDFVFAPVSLPPISLEDLSNDKKHTNNISTGKEDEREREKRKGKGKGKEKEEKLKEKKHGEAHISDVEWTKLNISDSSLNKDVFNFSSRVHANIFISFDNSLCSAQAESFQKVRLQIQKREYEIAQRAAIRIVQMSEVEDSGPDSPESNSDLDCERDLGVGGRVNIKWRTEYGSKREETVTVSASSSSEENGKSSENIPYSRTQERECLSSIFGCYYILYKYRQIFDRGAFEHIPIPKSYVDRFSAEVYRKDILENIHELREMRSKYVLADLLDLEQRCGIHRIVRLTNIVFEIPLDIVLLGFQATIQKHAYKQIMLSVADESTVKSLENQRRNTQPNRNSNGWNLPMCIPWCDKSK